MGDVGRSLRGCVLVGVLGVKYRQAGWSTEIEHNNEELSTAGLVGK